MTMQVPGHVVSMYVATCGKNGPDLGSDEKEIILLVYVIIDAATAQIVGVKQYLIRPTGRPGLERSISQQSSTGGNQTTNSTTATTTTTTLSSTPTIVPSNAIESTPILVNNNNNNSNNNNNNNNNNNINNNNTVINNNINNNLLNNNNNNTPLDIQQQQQQQQQLIQQNNSIPLIQNAELPIALAQAAGKPLNEAIEQFDEYIRSLSIDPCSTTNFKLITDGQLPLRQCLHPEASAKDIELPSYYCKFSDLRKEYVRYKSADLSRALVPVKDVKKLSHMPPLPPPPLSITDMMKELDLTSVEDNEFYVRESRDMVTVIQSLLSAGHKFEANEIVNMILEPGICSIDDEIDGTCIVRARGLPWQSSDQDIAKFFRGLNVAKGGVALCLSPLGRRNGEALIRFISQEHRDMALKRHKHHITSRYIEVYRASGEDFLAVAGGASNEAQAFLSKGAQVIIRMRGLPYDCTAKQVLDFFTTGENPCDVLDGVDGVLFVKKPCGRATGDAFVLFAKEEDAPHALSRHRESIGQRYIELFRSTTAEVQQVLNRSMDPKTYESNPPPLIAQLPPVHHNVPLLPQRVITSGTKKNCIRLRGLPYEAQVEHILHFLDDFAKNIIFQGVHMVFNSQGQPSGEAFIQMDSEESARVCALQKHNQFMIFGKKYRYIEVFQCSGDDMNLVLNGGLQSPVTPTKPALLSPGMLPQIQQQAPQQTVVTHPHHHLTHHPPPPSSQTVQHPLLPHHSAAAVAVSNALAAAASHHTHFTNAAAAANVPHYALSAHPIVAAGQPPSATAGVNAAAAVAAAAAHAHAAAAPQSLLPPQFTLHTAPNLAPNSATTQPPPQLALTIPPPANSALLAQQQAQFIAQQNLLARQNAAAVAAAAVAQNDSFLNVPNIALMQAHPGAANLPGSMHPAAAAAAAAAANYGLHPAHPAAQANAPGAQSPYFFMPARQFFHSISPAPIGLMPTPHGIHALQQLGAAQMQPPTSTATTSASALSVVPAMKRSYENAFQHENPNTASAPKRQLTRPPHANVYGFYHPGI